MKSCIRGDCKESHSRKI